MGRPGRGQGASDTERDEQFLHEIMGTLLNPRFQQAMTAMLPELTSGRRYWTSWDEEQEEPAPDEYTIQLECALERLGATSRSAAAGATFSDHDPEIDSESGLDLETLAGSLGLTEGLTAEQRAALAA